MSELDPNDGARVAFVGFGELGRQFRGFLESAGASRFLYFDDHRAAAGDADSHPFAMARDDRFSDAEFYISLGYHHLPTKKELLEELLRHGRSLPRFVHPTCFVNDTARIEGGAFLYPMCNVDKNVHVGAGTLLNNGVIVSHDSVIGSCCYLSPGVILSGSVTIGDCTFLGSGAIVSDGVRIGSNVIVGVGSVVTKDVPDDVSVIGYPMRIMSRKLNL